MKVEADISVHLRNGKRAVGVRETMKHVKSSQAALVYVAEDAEPALIQPIIELCRKRQIGLIRVPAMAELGRACGIDVGAAVAAVINEEGRA